MFVPPITEMPVTGEQAVECEPEGDETDADASVAVSQEDNKYCCPEPDTARRTNTSVVEEPTEAPEEVNDDQEDMNTDTFIDSTCRDEESDCSVEEETDTGYGADTEDDDDESLSSLNDTASMLWNNEASPMGRGRRGESQAANRESSDDTPHRSDCSDEKSNCQEKERTNTFIYESRPEREGQARCSHGGSTRWS
jgi:hypothetical protein